MPPQVPSGRVRRPDSSVITSTQRAAGGQRWAGHPRQLLYEIGGARYANPDAFARTLRQHHADRRALRSGTDHQRRWASRRRAVTEAVSLSGIGARSSGHLHRPVWTYRGHGALLRCAPSSKADPTVTRRTGWTLARTDTADADTRRAASALLTCVVRDPGPDTVGPPMPPAASNSPGQLPRFPHHRHRPATGRCTGYSPRLRPAGGWCSIVAVRPDGTRTAIPPPPENPGTGRHGDSAFRPVGHQAQPGGCHRAPSPAPAGATKAAPANVSVWCDRRSSGIRSADPPHRRRPQRSCCPETGETGGHSHLLPKLRGELRHRGDPRQRVAYSARFDPSVGLASEWLRGGTSTSRRIL